MDNSTFKEVAEAVESVFKSIALIVGAVWVYFKFIRTRENYPKIQFDLDLRIIGRQDGKIIIELSAFLENKGLVRHWVNNFTCDILILQKDAPVTHGDHRINYQVLFQKYNPPKEDEPNGPNRIVWIPKDWYYSFVDPGVRQQYTYLSEVPGNTTFICLFSQFYYSKDDFQTAQKAFPID